MPSYSGEIDGQQMHIEMRFVESEIERLRFLKSINRLIEAIRERLEDDDDLALVADETYRIHHFIAACMFTTQLSGTDFVLPDAGSSADTLVTAFKAWLNLKPWKLFRAWSNVAVEVIEQFNADAKN